MTVSTGIAITTSPDASAADLLRDADAAMYQAKEAGRARSAVFAESMRTRAVRRLETELALRHALTRGELRLHYQPIVNLTTGTTDGVEALVRWEHPTDGLIGPASSSRSPRRPASSSRSASGCSAKPAVRPRRGATSIPSWPT